MRNLIEPDINLQIKCLKIINMKPLGLENIYMINVEYMTMK